LKSEISVCRGLDDAALAPWVELADRLGVSRSLGQLYGLLFMANRPMSAQDCVEVLAISRSSAGQGLKVLREFGAIKSHFKAGDRSECFVIEPDLGVFLTKILDGRLIPAFVSFFSAMQSVRSASGVTASDRFPKLDRWEEKLVDAMAKMKEGLL
tara:strand:- start:15894 stop:16358 length:465 start_codon:yes stop_codon:yes gene_type:complete